MIVEPHDVFQYIFLGLSQFVSYFFIISNSLLLTLKTSDGVESIHMYAKNNK